MATGGLCMKRNCKHNDNFGSCSIERGMPDYITFAEIKGNKKIRDSVQSRCEKYEKENEVN